MGGNPSVPSLSDVLRLLDAVDTASSSTAGLVGVRSLERTSPLSGPPRPKSRQLATLDEIAARVDDISDAEMLSASDGSLARSLVSLLSCLQRLQELSAESVPPEAATAREGGSTSRPARSPEQTLGETLERGTSALLSTGRRSPGMTRALRQVEQAERDLLWGRVDDLADRVRVLSNQSVSPIVLRPDSAFSNVPVDENASLRGSIDVVSLSDIPPEYSHQLHARQDDPHSPPAYSTEALRRLSTSHDADEKHRSADPHLLAPRARAVSSAHSEKMRRDLDGVTAAIERLYVVSPQLANQRVEPDRRAQRERQLANLGNAIERLNQGRFEDQRAAPATTQKSDSEAQRAEAGSRRRLEPSPESDVAFERMLDQIDKAAGRTLLDQRVSLKYAFLQRLAATAPFEIPRTDSVVSPQREAPNDPGRCECASESASARDTSSLGRHRLIQSLQLEALFDESEAARRDFILRHTGRGRLNGQDAQLRSTASQHTFGAPPFGGASASADDAQSGAGIASAASIGPTTAATSEGREPFGTWKSLRQGFLKRAPGSRRGSQDASTWMGTTSEHALPPSRPRTPRTGTGPVALPGRASGGV